MGAVPLQVHAVQCDVRDPAGVQQAVSELMSVAGLPDVSVMVTWGMCPVVPLLKVGSRWDSGYAFPSGTLAERIHSHVELTGPRSESRV